MKSLTNFFATLLLLSVAISSFAYDFSAVSSSGQRLYYTITSSSSPYTVEVVSQNTSSPYYTTYPTGNLTIPSSVTYSGRTYSVTSIGEIAFYGCSRLTSVTIPNSVTNIGSWAFENCSGLTSVTIPNSVTSIGDVAFGLCSGLTSVTIPNSVTSIGSDAFALVKNIVYSGTATGSPWGALTVNGIIDDVFIYSDAAKTNLTAYIGSGGDVTIPNSVTSIGEYAFYNCSGLTSVTIGNSVNSIGNYAFYECIGLTSVTIPNSVTSIGSGAFYNCSGLTSVTIPNSVTSIGASAFSGCSGLTSVTIPNSVTSIGDYAFDNCTGLTSVHFNATNCTTMGSYRFQDDSYYPVFSNCTSLSTLNIGENVTNIPNYAFSGCSGLISVTIPNSVTAIGSLAFYGCSGLTTVNFNAINCTSMGGYGDYHYSYRYAYAFEGCTSFSTLNIGENVTNIPDYAFYGCSGLTSLTYNAANCTFGTDNGITGNTRIRTLTIGESVTYFPISGLSGLSSVYYNGSIASWCGITFSGSNYNPVYYAHNLYINGELLTNLVIPESISEVKPYSFCGASCITSLTIPNSVTSIGNYAFYGCSGLTTVNFNATNCTTMGSSSYPVFSDCTSLSTLNIGENVTNIPAYAFYGCSGLTELTLGESLTSIGDYAFSGCSALITLNYNPINCTSFGSNNGISGNTSLTTLTIGENVMSIPNSAFTNCSGLAGTIVIPNSVTNIGDESFLNCSGLIALSLGESVATIGNSAFSGCTALSGALVIPNSVTNIGGSAFSSCNGLTELTLGESLTSIGSYAFSGCSGLTSLTYNAANCAFGNNNGITGNTSIRTLTIGESVTNYPVSAFRGLSGLTSVYYNRSLADWCGITFEGTDYNPVYYAHNLYINGELLTNLVIPESVTEVKPYSFCGASCITSLTIPDYVTSIGNSAFSGCTALSGALVIPNSVTNIGGSAFNGCSGISSLTVGESVASIGESAFENCSQIRTMTLGSNVATIGDNAFANCIGLFMATVKPEFPPMAQSGTFTNVSSTAVIKVPCGSVAYYNAAQYWNYFTNVQGEYVYSLTVGCNNNTMGYATVVSAPTCNNPSGVISATAYDRYRFDSWNDGNTENPRTVTLTSDANYIANFASLYPTVYTSFTAEACGSYTWNDQSYTASGEYTQTFTAVNSADSIVTLTLTIHAMPIPTIVQSGTLDACNPSTVTLSVGNYSTYQWSNGATTATIEISTPGYYFVEVTDAYGCTGISDQTNIGLSNNLPEAPQISVVGMNSENHNVVAWSALDNENVNGYNIYREDNVADVYELVANVDASADTYWTDETADPSARAYRYKVTAVDQCGGESPMSDYHKTMHLTINRGIGNAWNLIWSHYEGFTFGTYRIYRGTSPSNMTMIGEVPSNLNSYTDNTATDNTGFYYQVEVVRNNRSRDAEISSRSNIVDNGIFPEYTITVMSANPNRGTVTGGGTYPEGTVITIEATALDGFVFASWSDENTENPRQITVTGNATYIASFDEVSTVTEYTITVMSANPNRGTVTGGGTYPEGTIVRIEANALDGFVFTSWSDDNTDNPRYITVTENATYIASFDPATGIEENASLEIALYPNPATDILNITSSEIISEIEIVNVMGQVVKRMEVNSENAVCDVEDLKAGVYVVRIYGSSLRRAEPVEASLSKGAIISQRKFIKE